jgi:hypothetical protein
VLASEGSCQRRASEENCHAPAALMPTAKSNQHLENFTDHLPAVVYREEIDHARKQTFLVPAQLNVAVQSRLVPASVTPSTIARQSLFS